MDLTKGNISKSLIVFSIPLILGNLFQQLYSLVNSIFVGNYLGVEELAAIGATYPVVFFITSMILGIGGGGSVVISHYYGAKDYDSVRKAISTFYIFFIVFGLVVCALGVVFADAVFSLLRLEDEVNILAVNYFRIYMIGMFFSVIFHSGISILRGLGDSTTQLWFLIPANILNAVLSYVFLGPMHLGIEASAWASVISQLIAFLSLFIYLGKTHEFVKLPTIKTLYFDKKYLSSIINVGVPTGLQQSIVSFTQILMLYLVAKFGTDATAAYSSAYRIESIALLFVLNISQALTSFVGTNIGADKEDRARKGLMHSINISIVLSLLTLLIMVFGRSWLIGLFTDNQDVIRIGGEYLAVSGWFWVLFCIMMMFTAFCRGTGYAYITTLISFVCLWLIRFPLSWALSLRLGTLGIWLGAPISWLIADVFYFIYYKRNKWTKSMIIKKSLPLIVLLLTMATPLMAQTDKNYFNVFSTKPINLPITSTGSFAELRGSHFHSGLDIRTNGKVGYKVYTPAEGYVSRIKVQAFGGGKNLYITHPNGYTTVYMHLSEYCGEIADFVKRYQYNHHCYEFDYVFSKPTIYLKEGDVIALSGESGSVAGPHLHFEIRKSKSENPVNPQLFFDIPDTTPPYIEALAISPYKNSAVEGNRTSKVITLSKDKFQQGDTISAEGDIYFSVLAYDPSQGSSMRNGVLDNELYINDELYFSHKINEFSFTNYGFVDAVINYPLYIKTGKRFLCSRLLENGKLPYDTYKNKGILSLKKDSVYKVTWVLTDIKSNTLKYTFYVKGVEYKDLPPLQRKASVKHFDCKEMNSYMATDSSCFIFQPGCLYESFDLQYSQKSGTYSNIHNLHTEYEPVKKKFTIKIKPYKIQKGLEKKYLVVKIDSKGRISSKDGYLKDGFVEASVGTFGSYAVWIDTIPPSVKPVNFKDNKPLAKNQKTLQVKISDNLSGIMSYSGYLNGKWILMEYDGKNALLKYSIDDKLLKGENKLKIVLTDKKNNVCTKEYTIIN